MRFVHIALLGIFIALVLYFFWGGGEDDESDKNDGTD